MKTYTIIAGVNGVGKSSFTGVLKEQISDLGIIINTDEIAKDNNLGNISAGKIALNQVDSCISNEENFTQETTLSGVRTLKNILKAKENGYKIRIYYIGINTLMDSLIRIDNRVRKGGHNIDVEDVTRRFNNRHENLSRILPYCDYGEIYDNENGFDKLADVNNGQIIKLSNKITPMWYNEMITHINNTLSANILDRTEENTLSR